MNENTQVQQFHNALAFYQHAPPGWLSGIEERFRATGVWLWETLQGDFNDNPSTAQVATGTVISMIPLVDQLCDVRDLVANCRKINQDSSDTWAWVAMALTLIGVFPVLGSLLKGCLKVLFMAMRRNLYKALKPIARDASAIEQGVTLLRQYLDTPAVRKTLSWLKIHNPYQYLADKLDWLKSQVTVDELLKGFKTLMQTTRSLLDKVVAWGPDSLKAPVDALWQTIERVFSQARGGLTGAHAHVMEYLDALSNRLRVEGDNAYRARPGVNNHVLAQRQEAELELLRSRQPDWVSKGETAGYPALSRPPKGAEEAIAAGWPNINASAPPLKEAFKTFDHTLLPKELAPGTRLYRVVDPSSGDNNICWMYEAEFKELTSKSQWRKEFAVWKHWNENGEYVIYTVPPGKPLKVWEGRAGTQQFEGAPEYTLAGGKTQVVLDPAELKPGYISPRQKTGWGYNDGTGDTTLDPLKPYLGLPELTNNWRMPKN